MKRQNFADEHSAVIPPDEVILMKGEQSILFLLNLGEGNMNWVARKQLSDSSVSPTPAEAKSRVLKEYANWSESVRKLIEATDAERILEKPICHRPSLKQWSYGRVYDYNPKSESRLKPWQETVVVS